MKTKNFSIFNIVNYLILSVVAIITIFPFYNVLIISLARYEDIIRQPLFVFPKGISLESYRVLLEAKNIYSAFFVSVFVTVAGTIYSLSLTTGAAYALSKKGIPGRKGIFIFVLFTMFFSAGLIPYYLVIKQLGFINSILVMIIPPGLSTFYLILMKNFFSTVPAALEESAKLDGANDIFILLKIIVPTSAPIIATIGLFYAVDRWNEWWNAMLFISNRKLYPLTMVLREVIQNFDQTMGSPVGDAIRRANSAIYQESVKMAIIVVTTIPILLVYPFLQKHFTKGIMIGALKD